MAYNVPWENCTSFIIITISIYVQNPHVLGTRCYDECYRQLGFSSATLRVNANKFEACYNTIHYNTALNKNVANVG